MNPKLLGSLLVGIIILTGVYIGTLSLNKEQITQNIVTDQQAAVSTALPSGLIAYLPFDNSSLSDASGNSNNGSWSGTSSFGSGKIGNGSASFSGSNYVSINNQVYPLSGGTVAFWFKSSGGVLTGSYGGSGNQRAPTLSINPGGDLHWEYSEFSNTGGDTGITVADGKWHHVALTYSGSNQVKVYLDGSLIVTDAQPAPGDFFDQVHIGHYGNYGSSFGNGQVDDFRIYNKALSASEVSAVYAYTGVVADTVAPVISNVVSTNLLETEAKISWTTDEPADTYVLFGLTQSYGNSSALKDTGSSMVTSHSQTLVGLKANTTYNYQVVSKDAAGNSASSGNLTFKTLAPPNVTPVVSLSAPTSATAPASVTLSASASDSDGTISKVDFYNGSTLINSDTSSPYSYSWTSILAGTYTLTAKATDNDGAVTTSNSVSLTVAPAPVGCAAGTVLSGTTCIPVSTAFSLGARVQTYNTTTINVRQVPDGTILGTQSAGIVGTVVEGPSYVGGLWWWKINYDSGADGWSVENFLKLSTIVTPPTQTTFTVTTAKAGTGSGTVTCSPSTCTANVGSSVSLTATPASGSTFTGWSGACTGTGTCTVTSAGTVTATFTTVVVNPTTYTVSVTKSGTNGGAGTVTSTGSINCGTTCTAAGTAGQTVTLTATPASGSIFTGWSGPCTGTSTTCSFVLNSNTTVNASFAIVPQTTFTVTTAKLGTGSGTVTCNPSTCSTTTGSSVTVTATPASSSTFVGWSGACTGTGTCSLASAGTVTATFNIIPVTGGTTVNLTPTTWNAMSGSSFVRGTTYVLAPGTYSGKTLNTPASGTQTITIKSDGTGQALFTGGITFNTSYWVFDGVTGPTWSKNVSEYGFAFSGTIANPFAIYNTSIAISDVTIAHVAAVAPSTDTQKFFVQTNNSTKAVSNVTISHSLINGYQNGYWATSAGYTMANWTFEYNAALNGFSSAANHGEWINNNYGLAQNQVTRFNLFEGSSSGCMTGMIVANNNNNIGSKVYGNVFNNVKGCNGLVTGTSAGQLNNAEVYNNTFVNSNTGIAAFNGPGTGNVAYNNLFYNNTNYDGVLLTANNINTSSFTSTNNYTVSVNPFVSSTDFRLKASLAGAVGKSLAAPYNTDVNGNVRGVDGVWDVGAFEYVGTTQQPPTTPNSTKFVSNDRIATTDILNVRSSPSASASLLGSQALGALGTVSVNSSNGVSADGYYWWNVNYDTGVDGWSVENYLVKYTAPTTPPTQTTFTVTTAKAGTGSGTITCSPSTCTANTGSSVSVTATPASGSTFVGWSGACTGTGACTVSSAGTVTATFNLIPVTGGTTVNVTPSTWSSLTFVRGTTYLLAPGTYPGKTLSTPASGTQLITIKPDGTGQVVFSSGFTFASSYWVIDGVTGSMSTNPADYGFKFTDGRTEIGFVGGTGTQITNITLSHIAAKAPTGDTAKAFFHEYTQVNWINNLTISNSLLDGYQSVVYSRGQGSTPNDNWLIERNMLLNGFSSAANHGEWIDIDGKSVTNLVVRYNVFKGANGGMTGSIVANNVNLNGAIVYGNIFDSVSVGNGIVTGTSAGQLNNAQVYNNTFLNSSPGAGWVNGGQKGGTGNIAKNNIIYNMNSSVGSGVTASFNDTPSSNPFTTVSGYGAASIYGLAAQTAAADTTVPEQYRTDMNGKVGTSRGAIQY